MSKSVRKGGTVCGPAPLNKNINVIELPVEQVTRDGAAGCPPVPGKTVLESVSDEPLAVARAALSNALKSQRSLEARLDKVCNSLLIAGEQIPTIDQSEYSMLQEAYINASTAFRVASEKSLIWKSRVTRLTNKAVTNQTGDDDWPIAA